MVCPCVHMPFACAPVLMIALGGGVFVCMEPCYISLLFLYSFEAMEPMWCHVLELQAKFKVPTYKVMGGALAPMDKECMGSYPKMFLYALDELLYVYQCIDNTDTQCVIAFKILSFASDRCMEWCDGRPKPECDTFGPAMPHVNLGDIKNLERLTWEVLGSLLALSGLYNWACILGKMTTHIFHGRTLWEHCPLSTVGGANTAAAAHLKGGRRNQQKRPQALWAPASPAPQTPMLWSIVNVHQGLPWPTLMVER